jgi:hypothetical protein
MRSCLLFALALSFFYPSWTDAAERGPSPSARVAQVAPDGFPLQFPQELPRAQPASQPAPTRAAEELPIPPAAPQRAAPVPESMRRPLAVLPVRYMTHREFAATFRPVPGNYEVTLLHPYTHRPVMVRFTLPPGRIKEVDADRSEIRFDYGHWELEVHFKRDGRVTLDIDD